VKLSIYETGAAILSVSQPDKVCAYRALVVQLMLLHGNEQQDGKRVIRSTGVPQKCQVTVHWVETVARCWFIPDSICLCEWHAWQWARVIIHWMCCSNMY